MSTRWITAGRYKLGPESRIACANLLLAVLLACATLVLGPVGGRCALSLATWGFLHAKSVCRSNPSATAAAFGARHAKTDIKQPRIGAPQLAVIRAGPLSQSSL
jgi:hypothetical protein